MPGQPTRYCDIVMKGGITSGVVYPNAVLRLSEGYRFKNIGGTSAGAIAAAAAAAAAHGDRLVNGENATREQTDELGFKGLEQASRQLAEQGFIFNLFQPASGTRRAYHMVVVLAGNAPKWKKAWAVAKAALSIAWYAWLPVFAAFLAIGYLMAGGWGMAAVLLPSILFCTLLATIAAIFRVTTVVRDNFFGMCVGMRPAWARDSQRPVLTEWLHATLQSLAGLPENQPLTFGDLWDAQPYANEPETEKRLTLTLITTSVSNREPRSLPFEEGTFYFDKKQFDRLFPVSVVNWLVAKGRTITVNGKEFVQLPEARHLPVLVATRMSLSFPLLISAVPLYEAGSIRSPRRETRAVDREVNSKNIFGATEGVCSGGARDAETVGDVRVCWFSDGGISSNFPIHLFDGPLPRWPTFAINLAYTGKADDTPEAAVKLPQPDDPHIPTIYEPIPRGIGAVETSKFLFGIIATMQNWRDSLQSRAAGHRERIVEIELNSREGGMNLDMDEKILTNISRKGDIAGAKFAEFRFDSHYWVRWRNLSSAMQRYATRIHAAASYDPKIPDYLSAYEVVHQDDPFPDFLAFGSLETRAEAREMFDRLVADGTRWSDQKLDLTQTAPRPLPQLQIAPTY